MFHWHGIRYLRFIVLSVFPLSVFESILCSHWEDMSFIMELQVITFILLAGIGIWGLPLLL